MGNSASKAIAKAAPIATKPIPTLASQVQFGRALPSATPRPSETKSAAIKADGQDPTFMQNLNALGAVTVPRSPTLFRSDNRMLDILAKRKAQEEEEEAPAPNRLSAQALSNLLDDRKGAVTREEVAQLAKEYGMSLEVLEELGRHINAPSVSSFKSLDEELEDTQMARWVDPKPLTLFKAPDRIASRVPCLFQARSAASSPRKTSHSSFCIFLLLHTLPILVPPAHMMRFSVDSSLDAPYANGVSDAAEADQGDHQRQASGSTASTSESSSSVRQASSIPSPPPFVLSSYESELSRHLHDCFCSPIYSDSTLTIEYADASHASFTLHAIIMTRSPLLTQALLHYPPQKTSVCPLRLSDPHITNNAMSICLAFLYSPSVLPHITSETCAEVLAASHFLQLDSLSEYAYNIAFSTIAKISRPSEIMGWFSFLGKREGEGALGSGGKSSNGDAGRNGIIRDGAQNGDGHDAVMYGRWGRQLMSELLERVLVSLPRQIEAETETPEGIRARLIEMLTCLPFQAFKLCVESTRFRVGDDMDRFNLGKKAVAARKKVAAGRSEMFDETVVLAFGGSSEGTSVSVLRKSRKLALWKVSSEM